MSNYSNWSLVFILCFSPKIIIQAIKTFIENKIVRTITRLVHIIFLFLQQTLKRMAFYRFVVVIFCDDFISYSFNEIIKYKYYKNIRWRRRRIRSQYRLHLYEFVRLLENATTMYTKRINITCASYDAEVSWSFNNLTVIIVIRNRPIHVWSHSAVLNRDSE